MTRQSRIMLVAVCIVAGLLMPDTADARRGGGGGGARGGGGGGRSYSSGSVRYSGGASRSSSYSRPSTTSSSRSSSSSYRSSSPSTYRPSSSGYAARPSTPSYRPSSPGAAQRPSGGYSYRPSSPGTAQRPSTGSGYRPSSPGTVQRPAGGSSNYISRSPSSSFGFTPSNSGSLIHKGSVTTPGGSTISGAVGPRGGGAVAVDGARGGTAGAVRGPGGGGAARAVGPVGGSAAGVRGPGGAAAGAAWGPGGYGWAGARGPYGGRYVTNLPAGAIRYPWRGGDYWHVGFGWYRPCWVGDSMYYGWAYPPIGFYYSSLPDVHETIIVNNTTYYESDNVYYQEGEQEGQKGYVVVDPPAGVETQPAAGPAAAPGEDIPNPFAILKTACDYVGGLERFSVVARTTSDELNAAGDKIQVSGWRQLSVGRPDKLAIEANSDQGSRRSVFDGRSFSLLDRSKNVYTAIKAPGTSEAALDKLAKDYGIVVPLQDIIYKDLYERLESRIVEAQYVGLHAAGGVDCHHLAFLTGDAEVEMWVSQGDKPLLQKITIVYRQEGRRSRFSADFSDWNAAPAFSAETFAFKPSEGARQIQIAPIGVSVATEAEGPQ